MTWFAEHHDEFGLAILSDVPAFARDLGVRPRP